jgi:hypothetical protein
MQYLLQLCEKPERGLRFGPELQCCPLIGDFVSLNFCATESGEESLSVYLMKLWAKGQVLGNLY